MRPNSPVRRTRHRAGRVGDRLEYVVAAQADPRHRPVRDGHHRRQKRCRRQILAAIAAEQLSRADAYDYAATEGDPPLHAALLEMLRGTSDETTADRLTITAGGMQGLDLFCKIFVDPGDLVVVESPTYTNGSATALSYGAELLEVPVDDDGMIVDDLTTARSRGSHARRRSTRSRRSRTRPA